MNNFLLLLPLLVTLTFASAQDKPTTPSLKALDETNGFRAYHFGDDISKFPHLTVVEQDAHTTFYKSAQEHLRVGRAELKELTYAFYKGKLFYISLGTDGLTNSRALLEALQAQYGGGSKSNPSLESYYWLGKQVTLHYQEDSRTGSARVSFASAPISQQKHEDDKNAIRQAGAGW